MSELLPDHLSYSSIYTYLNCPRQWMYKYILKRPSPSSEEQIVGKAIHQAVQGYLAEGGSVSTRYYAAFAEATRGHSIPWKTSPEAAANEGARLLSNERVQYGLNTLTLRSPADIERKIELHVPDVPVPVIGFIDWIDADGVPVDLKTSARSWSQFRVDTELQPSFYLAALAQAGEMPPAFKYVTLIKTREPKFETFTTYRTDDQIFWLYRLIREVWRAIYDYHYPPNPTNWMCSPTGCPYYAECMRKHEER